MQALKTAVVLVVAAVCVMGMGRVAGAALIIDDFNEAAMQTQVITILNPDPTLSKALAAGILGGERDLLLDVMGASGLVAYSGSVGQGTFAFNSSQPGTAATLQYDGIDVDVVGPPASLVNNEGLGGLDLTAGGSGFYLDFQSIDGGQTQMTALQIEVHGPGKSATFAGAIPDAGVPFSYVAPFAAFSDPSVFSNVTSITVRINPAGARDVDFELDQVGVPEPGTLALVGLGLAALIRRKR